MIYFIQVKQKAYVKIGFTSKCPLGRMAHLQGGNPFPLRLLGYIDGPQEIEGKLHRRFCRHRMKGEWFRREGRLKAFLDRVPLKQVEPKMPRHETGVALQAELLAFMKKYINENRCVPSFSEMAIAIELKSKSGVHRLIDGLEERGFIKRLHNRARAIEIVRQPQ